MKTALFIGNGINQIKGSGTSWNKLMEELSESSQIKVDVKNQFKPLPFLFEEMILKNSGGYAKNLRLVKKKVGRIFKKTNPNKFHKAIIEITKCDILTTNYDYSLEKAIVIDFIEERKNFPLSTLERKHSLRRKIKFSPNSRTIWHLHGEISDNKNYSEDSSNFEEESILIGFEHYAEYLGVIQNYVRRDNQSEDFNLTRKLIKQKYIGTSWVDYFFTHNLKIIGFSFDFAESHLWWLLNYRARILKSEKFFDKIKKNSITFFIPEFQDSISPEMSLEEFEKWKSKRQMLKAKIDMFQASNVKVESIASKDYNDFYNSFIKNYLKNL